MYIFFYFRFNYYCFESNYCYFRQIRHSKRSTARNTRHAGYKTSRSTANAEKAPAGRSK